MVDALARHWAGVPVERTDPELWLVDKDSLPTTSNPTFPFVEDYKAQWSKLWGESA